MTRCLFFYFLCTKIPGSWTHNILYLNTIYLDMPIFFISIFTKDFGSNKTYTIYIHQNPTI